MDQTFLEAYEVLRVRYPGLQWAALSPRELTTAIYREIRRLDAHRANAPLSRSTGRQRSRRRPSPGGVAAPPETASSD
jgi:hypothetical protein